jgi:hypothetical protein
MLEMSVALFVPKRDSGFVKPHARIEVTSKWPSGRSRVLYFWAERHDNKAAISIKQTSVFAHHWNSIPEDDVPENQQDITAATSPLWTFVREMAIFGAKEGSIATELLTKPAATFFNS